MKTDSQLQADVIAELQWDPSVHATQIGVEVKDGVVTLAGEIGTYGEKCGAERAALRVAGVQALAIELTVRATPGGCTDVEIGHAARVVLGWSTSLPVVSVKILDEDGWITLSGEADWQYQREAATDGVRFLAGVRGVSNQIAIKPDLLSSNVKADIEAALSRAAGADALNISVQVSGPNVILTGKVRSWFGRDLAVQAAWRGPGVRHVVGNMTLGF